MLPILAKMLWFKCNSINMFKVSFFIVMTTATDLKGTIRMGGWRSLGKAAGEKKKRKMLYII